MSRHTIEQALARCGRKCMTPVDGRTAAGAMRQARRELQAQGVDAPGADAMVQAMRRVGEAVARVASTAGGVR